VSIAGIGTSSLDTATLAVRLKWDSCRTRFYRHYGEHNFSYIRGSKVASYFWRRAWLWLKRASERTEERENEPEICIQFQPGLFCFTRFLRIHYAGRARLLKQSFILSMRLYRPQKGARFPACDTRVRVIHLRLVARDTKHAEIQVRFLAFDGVKAAVSTTGMREMLRERRRHN